VSGPTRANIGQLAGCQTHKASGHASRAFSDTFAGIHPADLGGFLIAQAAGATVGRTGVLMVGPDIRYSGGMGLKPRM
jgi:hypothetical protein